MNRILVVLIAAVVVLPAGCGRELPPPEEQIRALVTEAREAAEARDLSALRDLIADDYRDAQGRDKADLVNILRLVFLRHQSVHLLTRVQRRGLSGAGPGDPDRLRGHGRTPFPEQDIGLVRADLHRFDVTLREAGGGHGGRRWTSTGAARISATCPSERDPMTSDNRPWWCWARAPKPERFAHRAVLALRPGAPGHSGASAPGEIGGWPVVTRLKRFRSGFTPWPLPGPPAQ
jgi:hypothetical protein